jgi:hypothetical protein
LTALSWQEFEETLTNHGENKEAANVNAAEEINKNDRGKSSKGRKNQVNEQTCFFFFLWTIFKKLFSFSMNEWAHFRKLIYMNKEKS